MTRNTTNQNKAATMIPCPSCGQEVPFDTSSPCRPFCSERCRSHDLGAWASGSYRIQAPAPEDGLADDLLHDED